MKKGILSLVLMLNLVLIACNNPNQNENLDSGNNLELNEARANVETEELRIRACEEKTKFILNTDNISFSWEAENEGGASFYREGSLTYTKRDGTASEDVVCFIDMVDGAVNVEFSNHEFEGVEFYPEDDEDTLNAKWESYVNNSIALENDKCEAHSFISKDGEDKYGSYYCVQPSDNVEFTDYYRSGIYKILSDEWILTCNEANGEQGAGYNETVFGSNEDNKNCQDLEKYIEQQIIL